MINQETLKVYENLASTFRNSEFLNDALQEVIEKILNGKIRIPLNRDREIFIRHCCRNLARNENKSINRLDLLKQANCKFIDDMDSGITEKYIKEVIEVIESKLDLGQSIIFRLYHVIGLTCQDIGSKLGMTKQAIHLKLKVIQKQVDSIRLKYFYDDRYVRKISRSKREKVKWPIAKGQSGIGSTLTIEEYQKAKEVKEVKEVLPFDKCMSYPTKQYYEVKTQDRNVVADMGSNRSHYFISSLTLGHAKITSHVGTIEEVK